MSGVRYDRILASTALALIFAAPFGEARSQDVRISAQVTAVAAVTVPSTDTAALVGGDGAQPAVEDSASPAKPAETPTATTPANEAKPSNEMAAPVPAEAAPANSTAATAPEAAPDPLASLDPADRPIAEKIRDLLAAKSDRIFATKKERAAVEAFYEARNLAPLWFDKGIEAARTGAATARLKAADADGLDADDYKVPSFADLADAEARAEAELKMTQVVLTYARHVQAGRFPYSRVSSNIEVPQAPPEAADVLSKIAGAQDVARALDEFSPPHEAYQKLKAALAKLRGESHRGHKQIDAGPLLKPQQKPMEDARVPALRERLGVAGDSSDLAYDDELVEAVKKFQKESGLQDDGVLGSRTLEALNGPGMGDKIDIVLANMERWRWFPRDLGKAYSMVNIPDFTLKVMNEGSVVWKTRVVVGKPATATPLLTETMKYITVNPTWNVPPSIVYNEYLPALQQDPTVLARMGLRVSYNRDGSVHISQPPGEANALGRIRFNFPNRFLVYQHDTNEKHYFARDVRAYSHGCMRVQDPAKYAEVMLGLALPEEGYTAERIKKMYGTKETNIQFPAPIPVHLTYQSAFVDDDGKLEFRRDVYGIDDRTIAALKDQRAMVYAQGERPKETGSGSSSSQRRAAQPRTVSFIEALFGGFRQTPPRRVAR